MKKIISLTFCIVLAISNLTGMPNDYLYYGKNRVVVEKNITKGVNTLTQSMINQPNTVYVIQHDFVLSNDITIPENCILEFEGGSLIKGTLNMNHSIVIAPNVKIFNSVKLNNVGNDEFNAEWVLGTEENVSGDFFYFLPQVPINFNNRIYKVASSINISMYAVWKNLNLYVRSISFVGEVLGTVGCYKDIHLPLIVLSSNPKYDIIDKLALIKTANHVANDWREDKKGIPTLYKGMSTLVSGYNTSNSRCYLSDNMENFSATVSYKGRQLVSSVTFANPATVELYNCRITTTKLVDSNMAGGVAIVYAKDIKLVDCEISTLNNIGSENLCSIRQCVGGIVERCNVHHAWYNNSQESYGIQCNASTRINIVNCQFAYNRRSVDFSGEYETRYSVVDNCMISGGTDVGSGVGSHSTSYGNSFRNNIITGAFTYGIWCRGEHENVEGNNILSVHSKAAIAAGYKTKISNNSNRFNRQTAQNIAIDIYDIPGVNDNELIIDGNSFLIGSALVNIPYSDAFYGKVTLINNIIDFNSNLSSYSLTERIFKKHIDNIELNGNVFNFDDNQYNSIFADNAEVTKGIFTCTIPVKFVYWKGGIRDLTNKENSKIISSKCYLVCDWSSEIQKTKLYIDFTIKGDFIGPIGFVPVHFRSIDTRPKFTPDNTTITGWKDGNRQEFTYRVLPDIIYLGKGTQYNGIFTAGHYCCVIEWN